MAAAPAAALCASKLRSLLRFWPASFCCCCMVRCCCCLSGASAGAAAAAPPAATPCAFGAASCFSTSCSCSRSCCILACKAAWPSAGLFAGAFPDVGAAAAAAPPLPAAASGALPAAASCCRGWFASCCCHSAPAAAAACARCCACSCTAASASASTWNMRMDGCMASERPTLTMAGALLAPEPHHNPVLARRMISSSMAALLCAHTSTRIGGMTPSFNADGVTMEELAPLLLLLLPPAPPPVVLAAAPGACRFAAVPAVLPAAVLSRAESMPTIEADFPVPGGPWTRTNG